MRATTPAIPMIVVILFRDHFFFATTLSTGKYYLRVYEFESGLILGLDRNETVHHAGQYGRHGSVTFDTVI